MLNYVKSEWYRIVHGRELYLFTGALCAIVLAGNVLLWVMSTTPDFPYATVRFSMSNLISMLTLLFFMAGLLVWVLFADDRKDGTFKRHCFQLLLKLGRGTVDNIVKTDRLGTNLLRAGDALRSLQGNRKVSYPIQVNGFAIFQMKGQPVR